MIFRTCLLGMRLVSCIGRADEPNRPQPVIRATTPRTGEIRYGLRPSLFSTVQFLDSKLPRQEKS